MDTEARPAPLLYGPRRQRPPAAGLTRARAAHLLQLARQGDLAPALAALSENSAQLSEPPLQLRRLTDGVIICELERRQAGCSPVRVGDDAFAASRRMRSVLAHARRQECELLIPGARERLVAALKRGAVGQGELHNLKLYGQRELLLLEPGPLAVRFGLELGSAIASGRTRAAERGLALMRDVPYMDWGGISVASLIHQSFIARFADNWLCGRPLPGRNARERIAGLLARALELPVWTAQALITVQGDERQLHAVYEEDRGANRAICGASLVQFSGGKPLPWRELQSSQVALDWSALTGATSICLECNQIVEDPERAPLGSPLAHAEELLIETALDEQFAQAVCMSECSAAELELRCRASVIRAAARQIALRLCYERPVTVAARLERICSREQALELSEDGPAKIGAFLAQLDPELDDPFAQLRR